MCVPENTSQPANVEIVCRRCTIYAMQQAAIPCVGKGCAFFDKLEKPSGRRAFSIDRQGWNLLK
jgi:hypothetical protein